jgi:hypothetical protein
MYTGIQAALTIHMPSNFKLFSGLSVLLYIFPISLFHHWTAELRKKSGKAA